MALARLLAQKPWIVPTKLRRLDENQAAVEVQLSPDELREIAIAVGTIEVQGARLPAQMVAATGR